MHFNTGILIYASNANVFTPYSVHQLNNDKNINFECNWE